jgi:transcriptional regulator with XRE-family HTH domain
MKNEIVRGIGWRLKEAREAVGLTQNAVSREQGFSRQSLSSWECGRYIPDCLELMKLLQLYGASADYILFGITTVPADFARIVEAGQPRAYADQKRRSAGCGLP